MKYVSIFEEQNKVPGDDWSLKYSEANDVVGREIKKSKISLFYDSNDMGFDLHAAREEANGIVEDFHDLIDGVGGGIEDDSLVVDTGIEADAGGGGGGIEFIPTFNTVLKVVFVFVFAQSVTGFLQEAGKDFYVYVKSKIKKARYRKSWHVFFVIRGKKQEAKFLFQSHFSEEIFEEAWAEMLKFNVDKLDIEKYEERIYIFDTKTNEWVIFN